MEIKIPVGTEKIKINDDKQIQLDFESNSAILSKLENSLIFDFGNGNIVEIENFYSSFNSENKPIFVVNDIEIDCNTFFNALGAEDLIPAAGPSNNVVERSRSHEYSNLELLEGIDKLGGLDLGFNDNNYEPEIHGGIGNENNNETDENIVIISEPELIKEPYNGLFSVFSNNTYEGNDIGISLTIDNAPKSDMQITVRVDFGNSFKDYVLTLPKDTTEITIPVKNLNEDDVFLDPSKAKITIVNVEGGDYDNIAIDNNEPTISIKDTINDVHFTVITENTDENSEYIPVKIISDDPNKDGNISVTIDVNGTEYIANLEYINEQWEGYINIPVRNDDLLINGDESFTINVINSNHDGLIYENPIYPEPVVVKVIDDKDTVNFNISSKSVDENANKVTFIVTANDTLTDGNIQTVIDVNGTEYNVQLNYIDGKWIGELDIPVREDNVFIDGTDTYIASIISASHDGMDYENPVYDSISVNVTDDKDSVHFKISGETIDENSNYATFIITSDDTKTTGNILVNVDVNGIDSYSVVLHYEANTWIGKLMIPIRDDNVFVDTNDEYVATIVSAKHSGFNEYENAVFSGPAISKVIDDSDMVSFSIHSINTDENSEFVRFEIISDDPTTNGNIQTIVVVNDKKYNVELSYENDEWIGHLDIPVRDDNVFVDGTDTYVASVFYAEHDGKTYEMPYYGYASTANVTDDTDEVHFTISSQSVDENAETVSFIITSDDPKTDGNINVIVDINNEKHIVTLEYINSQWIGELDIPVREDNVFIDGTNTYVASIKNATHSGLEYENPVYGDNAVAKISDDTDEVHFNITGTSVNENADTIEFTVVSDDPETTGTIHTVIEVNGISYKVDLDYNNGWVGTLELPIRNDDIFINGTDTYVANIISAIHDNKIYENPVYGNSERIIVVDDNDKVDFAITGKSVDENAKNIVFDITSNDNNTDGYIAVTVDINGFQHIVNLEYVDNQWSGMLEIPVREDNVFIDGTNKYSAKIINAEHIINNENYTYENPAYPDTITVNVTDDSDKVNFIITGKSIDENSENAIFTITSDDPEITGTINVTVEVNNETYFVNLEYANGWTGTFEVPIRNDNVFVDGTDTYVAKIIKATHSGLKYENPAYNEIAVINVTDDSDEVHFSIVSESTDENSEYLTFTIYSDDPKEDGTVTVIANVNNVEYSVNLEHYRTIWKGSFDIPVRDDNGFIDGTDTYSAKIIEAKHNGLEYENPNYGNEINVLVTDDSDAVHFFINSENTDENSNAITFNITSDDKNTKGYITTIVTINKEQYEVILNYDTNEWKGTLSIPIREDNVFIDEIDVYNGIISSAYHTIGNENYIYENPVYDSISVNVTDDNDPVHFTIAANNTTEKSDSITFTITSDDPKTDGELSVVIDINGVSTIVDLNYIDNQWQGTISIPIRENDIFINEDNTYVAKIVSASHNNMTYENPIYSVTNVIVTDWIDEVHFTITGNNTNENATYATFDITSDDPKTDGIITVTVDVNGTEYEVTLEYGNNGWIGHLNIPIREDNQFIDEDDVYVGKIISAHHDNLTYENPIYDESVLYVIDDKDKVEFHITAQSTDENNDFVTYTVTSNDKNPDGDIIVNVIVNDIENTVELEYVNGQWIGEFTSTIRVDDKYINGTDTFTAKIEEAVHVISGKEYYYEDINLPQSIEIEIIDDIDISNLEMSASKVINGEYDLTISIDSEAHKNLNIELSNSETVTIENGNNSSTVKMTYDGINDISIVSINGYEINNNEIVPNKNDIDFYEKLSITNDSVHLEATPYTMTFIVNMAQNLDDYIDENVTKIEEQLSKIYDMVSKAVDEHGTLNIGIIPYALRAYTPGTNSYVWDLGDKGQYFNFTKENLEQFKIELQTLSDVRKYHDNNSKEGELDQWMKAHHVKMESDVVFDESKQGGNQMDSDGNQVWDATQGYFTRNNYTSAFECAKAWIDKVNPDNGIEVDVFGGYWNNYNNGYDGFTKKSYKFQLDRFAIEDLYRENQVNGVYTDDVMSYTMINNELHYKMKNSLDSEYVKLVDYYKTVNLPIDLPPLVDGAKYTIGGYEYKVVYQMSSIVLYRFNEDDGQYHITNGIKISKTSEAGNNALDNFLNTGSYPAMWTEVIDAYNELQDSCGNITIYAINGKDELGLVHEEHFYKFLDYLNDNVEKGINLVDVDYASETDGFNIIFDAPKSKVTDALIETDGTNNSDIIFGTGYTDTQKYSDTDFDDVIYGNDGDDVIYGSSGNDIIYGDNGNDIIFGGKDNDTIYGGKGNDYLNGGKGNDYLDGNSGNNILLGGDGNDILIHSNSNILEDGGNGLDILLNSSNNISLLTDNKIKNIEIELNGNEVNNIKSIDDLSKYDILIANNKVELEKNSWIKTDDETYQYVGNDNVNLTIALGNDMVQQNDTLIFILENGLN